MKLIILDANNLLHMAYHALPPLNDRQGRPTGAVTGFLNTVLAIQKTASPTHIGVVFDGGGNHRRLFFSDYKGNRSEMPEDLYYQYKLVRKFVKKLNWEIVSQDGFEADDIIASLASRSISQGLETVIYSSDKDFIQLMPKGVKVYLPISKQFRNDEYVKNKFGIGADQFLEYQIFIGDGIDNVKGFRGIGAKTAITLLEEYDTVMETVFNAHKVKKPKIREVLINSIPNFTKIIAGVTLIDDLPLNKPGLDWLRVKSFDESKFNKYLLKYDLKSIQKRVERSDLSKFNGNEKGLFD